MSRATDGDTLWKTLFDAPLGDSVVFQRIGRGEHREGGRGPVRQEGRPALGAGVIGALAVMQMQPILPYALAFAAGAMIYVVIEEVVPETQQDKYTDIATLGFIGGFLVMMLLDVGLG
jgi:ZIP family zinc transporter